MCYFQGEEGYTWGTVPLGFCVIFIGVMFTLVYPIHTWPKYCQKSTTTTTNGTHSILIIKVSILTLKNWRSHEPDSRRQGILFWVTRSCMESMGTVILGTVSMAVRIPLYDDMKTREARSHVTTKTRLPSVLGSHSVPAHTHTQSWS